jgi:NADPH:quinone reductase-like Zn-dependent oxidoreductase
MGITAIQFAKLSGALVVTTSSPSNFDYLRSIGADHVLDYKSSTLVQDILAITGGPICYAFDTHPTDTSTAVAAAILNRSSDARYVSLHPGQEQNVKALNPDVNAQFILAYSAFGDPWIFGQQHFAAVPDDYEFQKKFILIADTSR